MTEQKVSITRVNISSPNGCQVKKPCNEEAYWFVGKLSVCEKHFREFCKLSGIDYDDCVEEVKGKFARTHCF